MTEGPPEHRHFVCSVGHQFSFWNLYESKETELERAQWSTMALLMHLQMILEMLLDARALSDAPDSANLRQRKGEWVAGVLLTGGGSDGAHGLVTIKAQGGLSIVQRPS